MFEKFFQEYHTLPPECQFVWILIRSDFLFLKAALIVVNLSAKIRQYQSDGSCEYPPVYDSIFVIGIKLYTCKWRLLVAFASNLIQIWRKKCRAWSESKLFDILIDFLKDFFKKLILKKNQQTTKKHAKLPSMQRFERLMKILHFKNILIWGCDFAWLRIASQDCSRWQIFLHPS